MSAYDLTDAERICTRITAHLPEAAAGSLRIWGQWFGRPREQFHTIASCSAEQDVLCVTFDSGERLTLWSPGRATISGEAFCVETARRVRWEWFYYDAPPTPKNVYFLDYSREDGPLIVQTNVNWMSTAITDQRGPAAELVPHPVPDFSILSGD
ncbi:hypothetical protein BH11PSE1_BH11PSE1_09030 [soil metagenome]